MMQTRSGYGYAELAFDKHASVVDRSSYDELLDAVGRDEIDDVVVLVHGWNNDMADARLLYQRLAVEFRSVADSAAGARLGLAGRRLALLGLLWPSAKFAERDLIPGGAAAIGSPVPDQSLWAHLTDLHDVFDAPDANPTLDAAAALVPALDHSVRARTEFTDLLRRLLPPPSTEDHDDLPDQLRRLPGSEVLRRFSAPVLPTGPTGGSTAGAAALGTPTGRNGRSSGEGAALGLSFGGFKAAGQRMLNLLTYYQMKTRAGVIGTAAAPVLLALRERHGATGVHLVGHSFGGRLVTAAAAGGPGRAPLLPESLTLLQAAYSHYGLARAYDGDRNGFFRSVVVDKLVRGPVLVTHSDRDLAVGLAYPLASRLARQDSSALGDANDRYGGIGRNGAQKTPEAVNTSLLATDQVYRLADAAVHNLRSDHVIAGHSDIVRPEVAYAILSAVAARAGLPAPG
jgi:pimeloyl-ACP methyl ester carboxylesterase